MNKHTSKASEPPPEPVYRGETLREWIAAEVATLATPWVAGFS